MGKKNQNKTFSFRACLKGALVLEYAAIRENLAKSAFEFLVSPAQMTALEAT